MKQIYGVLVPCFVGLPCVLAQQAKPGAADDTDNLVKQTQNPVASLISAPFQNNLKYPIGPFTRHQHVLLEPRQQPWRNDEKRKKLKETFAARSLVAGIRPDSCCCWHHALCDKRFAGKRTNFGNC